MTIPSYSPMPGLYGLECISFVFLVWAAHISIQISAVIECLNISKVCEPGTTPLYPRDCETYPHMIMNTMIIEASPPPQITT